MTSASTPIPRINSDPVGNDEKQTEEKEKEDGPPPTGFIALVFTDVQNSTKLWDSDPAAMRDALNVQNDTLRSQIRKFRGYEVKTEGDAFMVAFSLPIDAMNFCIASQIELLKVWWPEDILQLPDSQVEYVEGLEKPNSSTNINNTYLNPNYKGGSLGNLGGPLSTVSSAPPTPGYTSPADFQFPASFPGSPPGRDTAPKGLDYKEVSSSSSSGEEVAEVEVFLDDNPEVDQLKLQRKQQKHDDNNRATKPWWQEAREQLEPRPEVQEPASPRIPSSKFTSRSVTPSMASEAESHSSFGREPSTQFDDSRSGTPSPGASPTKANKKQAIRRRRRGGQLWTAEERKWKDPTQSYKTWKITEPPPGLLWRGLRVRIGLHVGEPIAQMDTVTGRMDYFGPMVNLAARVASQSHGGQIVLSQAALKNIAPYLQLSTTDIVGRQAADVHNAAVCCQVEVVSLGCKGLKGIAASQLLFQVMPKCLRARKFPLLTSQEAKIAKYERMIRSKEDMVLTQLTRNHMISAQAARLKYTIKERELDKVELQHQLIGFREHIADLNSANHALQAKLSHVELELQTERRKHAQQLSKLDATFLKARDTISHLRQQVATLKLKNQIQRKHSVNNTFTRRANTMKHGQHHKPTHAHEVAEAASQLWQSPTMPHVKDLDEFHNFEAVREWLNDVPTTECRTQSIQTMLSFQDIMNSAVAQAAAYFSAKNPQPAPALLDSLATKPKKASVDQGITIERDEVVLVRTLGTDSHKGNPEKQQEYFRAFIDQYSKMIQALLAEERGASNFYTSAQTLLRGISGNNPWKVSMRHLTESFDYVKRDRTALRKRIALLQKETEYNDKALQKILSTHKEHTTQWEDLTNEHRVRTEKELEPIQNLVGLKVTKKSAEEILTQVFSTITDFAKTVNSLMHQNYSEVKGKLRQQYNVMLQQSKVVATQLKQALKEDIDDSQLPSMPFKAPKTSENKITQTDTVPSSSDYSKPISFSRTIGVQVETFNPKGKLVSFDTSHRSPPASPLPPKDSKTRNAGVQVNVGAVGGFAAFGLTEHRSVNCQTELVCQEDDGYSTFYYLDEPSEQYSIDANERIQEGEATPTSHKKHKKPHDGKSSPKHKHHHNDTFSSSKALTSFRRTMSKISAVHALGSPSPTSFTRTIKEEEGEAPSKAPSAHALLHTGSSGGLLSKKSSSRRNKKQSKIHIGIQVQPQTILQSNAIVQTVAPFVSTQTTQYQAADFFSFGDTPVILHKSCQVRPPTWTQHSQTDPYSSALHHSNIRAEVRNSATQTQRYTFSNGVASLIEDEEDENSPRLPKNVPHGATHCPTCGHMVVQSKRNVHTQIDDLWQFALAQRQKSLHDTGKRGRTKPNSRTDMAEISAPQRRKATTNQSHHFHNHNHYDDSADENRKFSVTSTFGPSSLKGYIPNSASTEFDKVPSTPATPHSSNSSRNKGKKGGLKTRKSRTSTVKKRVRTNSVQHRKRRATICIPDMKIKPTHTHKKVTRRYSLIGVPIQQEIDVVDAPIANRHPPRKASIASTTTTLDMQQSLRRVQSSPQLAHLQQIQQQEAVSGETTENETSGGDTESSTDGTTSGQRKTSTVSIASTAGGRTYGTASSRASVSISTAKPVRLGNPLHKMNSKTQHGTTRVVPSHPPHPPSTPNSRNGPNGRSSHTVISANAAINNHNNSKITTNNKNTTRQDPTPPNTAGKAVPSLHTGGLPVLSGQPNSGPQPPPKSITSNPPTTGVNNKGMPPISTTKRQDVNLPRARHKPPSQFVNNNSV